MFVVQMLYLQHHKNDLKSSQVTILQYFVITFLRICFICLLKGIVFKRTVLCFPFFSCFRIHQIPYIVFETTGRFTVNFASLQSIMTNKSSVDFQLKPCIPWTKHVWKFQIPAFSTAYIKFTILLISFLKLSHFLRILHHS